MKTALDVGTLDVADFDDGTEALVAAALEKARAAGNAVAHVRVNAAP